MSYNSVSLSQGDGSVVQFSGGGGSGASSASAVSYSNTESGLEATNVQGAIDELAARPASSAVLNITTTSPELFGQTVTVSGDKATYTGTFSEEGQVTIKVAYVGQYTVSCQGASNTVSVVAVGAVYPVVINLVYTTLNITCMDSALYGETLTISFGGAQIGTIAIDSSGKGSYKVTQIGTYTIAHNGEDPKDVEVIELDVTIEVSYGLVLATFSAATEEQIAAMIAAADAGQIDLYEDAGWRVGQTRTVSLSAIASSGTYDGVTWSVGESQSAQSVTLVLMHQGSYTLVNPVKSKTGATRTTCSFVCGLKDCLATKGYMNSTNTNNGSWSSSARRAWCNGGFRQALPETLRSCFKQFKTITGTWNNSATGGSNVTSQDYFALAAGKEVFGGGSSTSYSTDNEANALTQFTWYQTTSNRIKNVNGSANRWWERSPCYNDSTYFCNVYANGNANGIAASNAYGLAPFGCL